MNRLQNTTMKSENITKSRSTDAKRRYDDACAATHGMDIIGERWALPVMRELMLGPRRFSQLRRSLPALSANVLTQRLEGLEASGIVRKMKLPPPASVQVYALTEWGQQAGPVLHQWNVSCPKRKPSRATSSPAAATSIMVLSDSISDTGLNGRVGSCSGLRAAQRPSAWNTGPACCPHSVRA